MVVDVYAKWAGPCSLMRPVILKVKAKVRLVSSMCRVLIRDYEIFAKVR